MKSLLDASLAEELKDRIGGLRPNSERLWGKMSPAQCLAHCAAALQMALGDVRPPRALLGRIIGAAIKRKVVGDDKPLRRNSPTVRELVIPDQRNLDQERVHLCALIDRFVSGGAAVCTSHPHPFFGRLTPSEWGVLMYKHLDHHLRQFGV